MGFNVTALKSTYILVQCEITIRRYIASAFNLNAIRELAEVRAMLRF